MAKLVGIGGLVAGREFPVGELCIIGRSPNAHVRLPDLAVSRQHAKITRQSDGFTIEDLESASGTVVNDHYVTVSHVRSGDEVTICGFRLRFVDEPVDRMPTAEFSLEMEESQARLVSVDAAQYTRARPEGGAGQSTTEVRLTRRLNAILAVGQAASRSSEASGLLQEVVAQSLEVFPAADRVLVAVPDRQRQSLAVQAIAKRRDVADAAVALSRTVVSEVLYRGRSVIAGVIDGDSGGTMMVAPLICQGQMLGLVHVEQLEPKATPFVEEDLEVLTGTAAHIALALHSVQLRETLVRQSRTEQELAAAHEVQKRFLPRGVPKMAGFSFVAHYDPCRDVGGDLYDFIPLDAGRLGVVIGDVSGKGFAAAIVMAWVASQLRVAAHQERNPMDVLARVNESLLEAHQDDLFVTLVYGVLSRWNMSFHFCNAGHVPPLVRRQNGQVEVVEEGTGLPVGVVRETAFDERRVLLGQGDILLLVTDGVTEAMNAQRRMFGISGLASAVSHSRGAATTVVSDVLAAVRGFVNGETQYDDTTVVAVGASTDDLTTTLPPDLMRSNVLKP